MLGLRTREFVWNQTHNGPLTRTDPKNKVLDLQFSVMAVDIWYLTYFIQNYIIQNFITMMMELTHLCTSASVV